jgi:hypothetical protein
MLITREALLQKSSPETPSGHKLSVAEIGKRFGLPILRTWSPYSCGMPATERTNGSAEP